MHSNESESGKKFTTTNANNKGNSKINKYLSGWNGVKHTAAHGNTHISETGEVEKEAAKMRSALVHLSEQVLYVFRVTNSLACKHLSRFT